MSGNGDRLRYALLFLLALTLRLIYGLAVMGHPSPDYKGDEMERAAASVAVQGEIANVYSDTSGPSANVSPLYPYFLGGLYRLAGLPGDGGWIAQVLAASIATAAGIARSSTNRVTESGSAFKGSAACARSGPMRIITGSAAAAC